MPEDFPQRRDSFLKDYKDLIDKYQVDFFSFPSYFPSKDGDFRLVISTEVMDKTAALTPSNIVVNDNPEA